MNKRLIFASSLIATVVITPLGAHEGAMGIVKERMDAMETIKDSMKPIRQMVRGDASFNKRRILENVQAIKAVSGDIPGLFPEDSLQKPSEALPAIWENWDDFTMKANRFNELVLSFEKTVEAGNRGAVKTGFRELSRTCKGCHDDYKAD